MTTNENKNKNSTKAELLDFLKTLVICMAVVFALTNFILRPVRVDGNSMYPTLHDGDVGFSNLIGRSVGHIDRFDIAIIYVPEKGEYLVKRVIGLPGDTVAYREGKLYINGQETPETFLEPYYTKQFGNRFMNDIPEIHLKENEYYCLGDNRPDSLDSRFYGPFKADQIISKGVLVIWPFSEFGVRTW